jgi:hypothetical protein
MISIAAAYLHLARRDHPNILLIILFILFIIASQAFNETASVITILLFSAILALLILKRISLGVNAIVVTLIGLLSSLAGLMIVFFAPGTAARRAHSTSSIDIQTLLTAPFGNFTYLIDILTSWRVLLIVTVGFAIWILMPRILKKRKFEIAIVGALLSAVPIYFNGLVAYYGVGGTPLRAYTIPTFLTVIGLSILIALMLQYIKPVKRTWFTHLRAMSLPVLIFCSLVITVSIAIPLIQAQVLRKSLVEYRTASIHKQINDNSAQISVAPAPNLLVSSEAVDLAYNENQTGWFVVYLQKYYKFDDKKMVIERHQPESYCLSDQAPSWFGAYICKDIANVR